MESENDIMEQIYQLSKNKTVILISHRLANVVKADKIYVLRNGYLEESGTIKHCLCRFVPTIRAVLQAYRSVPAVHQSVPAGSVPSL